MSIYIEGNKLKDGTGGFGQMYYARTNQNEKKYTLAIKKITLPRFKPLGMTSLREFDIQYNCNLPHILNIKDFYVENKNKYDSIFFIYDLGKCDLWKLIMNYKVPISHKKIILFQMLVSLYNCHSYGIIHFDIKLNNFIVFYKNGLPHICLSDFGLSHWNTKSKKSKYHALRFYSPPEYFEDDGTRINIMRTSQYFDIWSLAHSFYEVISENLLIKGNEKTSIKQIYLDIQKFYNGNIKDNLKTLMSFYIDIEEFNKPFVDGIINTGSFDDFIDLLSNMFAPENKRYSVEQCLNNKLFKGFLEFSMFYGPHNCNLRIPKSINIIYHKLEKYNSKFNDFLIKNSKNLMTDRERHLALDIIRRININNLHIINENELDKIICYMTIKYYIFNRVINFSFAFNKNYNENEYLVKELIILKELNFRIYRPLVFDLITKNHSDLFNYFITNYNNGSNINVKKIAINWDNRT